MRRKIWIHKPTNRRVVVVKEWKRSYLIEEEHGLNMEEVAKEELEATSMVEDTSRVNRVTDDVPMRWSERRKAEANDEYAYDRDRGFFNYW